MLLSLPLWVAKRRVEQRYQRALQYLLKNCINYFADVGKIAEFQESMTSFAASEALNKFAMATAGRMITSLFDDVGNSWRSAAKENSQGKRIYNALYEDVYGERAETLAEQIRLNAMMIRTLPEDTANRVTEYILRETVKGRRPDAIEEEIKQMFPRRTKARAKLIARTEVAKIQTALVQTDCERVGVQYYIWRSAKDARTRGSHLKMNGVICSWNDPPDPEALFPERNHKPYGHYPPGGTFNCRCYAVPLINKYQLKEDSYKVHQSGQIVRMSRSKLITLL